MIDGAAKAASSDGAAKAAPCNATRVKVAE